jgi:opacity protein-like surface antigen
MKRIPLYFLMVLMVPVLLLLAYPASAANGAYYSEGYGAYGTGSYWSRMDSYLALKGGALFPRGDIKDFDTSFYGEVALGGRFLPYLGTELSAGWTRPEIDGNKLTIVPVMLNLKLPIPVGPIHPYILGGVGWYWAEDELPTGAKDRDNTFGWQAGAGIDFRIAPAVTVGVEGKYHWAKPSLFGQDVNLEGISVAGTLGFHF